MEEQTMRYTLALLAVGMSLAAAVPGALAQTVNRYGNVVVPLQQPGGNGGSVCYVDGEARSCVQPAAVTLDTGSGSGSLAGAPAVPVDTSRENGNNR
jgi:hypothetical protein